MGEIFPGSPSTVIIRETFDFLSDALIVGAFFFLSLTFIAAVNRQRQPDRRFIFAAKLHAAGMLLLAFSILSPYAWPVIDDTIYEFLPKLFSTAMIVAATYLGWPIINLAFQHTRLLAAVPDTQLLILERDDYAAAKTKLEQEIVIQSYQLERVNRQMRLAILGSKITIFRQDKEFRYTWIFNVPLGMSEDDFIGRTDYEIFPPDTALSVVEIKSAAMHDNEERAAEIRVRFPSGVFWYYLRTQPDFDEAGETIGTISCAVDISEQKKQQSKQLFLMREVTHRSKNLLAVLQGIVRQTARRTKDMDVFQSRLTARLQSLARSHDLLVNDDWRGTSLCKLLTNQLGVIADTAHGRVSFEGEDMLLTPVAVQNLGLAFHELSTNATKYGSLSVPEGRILICWDFVKLPSQERQNFEEATFIRFVWTETGGPPVKVKQESGFGRVLLERVVGQALGGRVELDFAETGLVCTMTLPVVRAVADQDTDNTALEDSVYKKAYLEDG